MADTKYILRYLPLFYEELEEKVVYYVVPDDEGSNKIMEVRHFLYNKQNRDVKI